MTVSVVTYVLDDNHEYTQSIKELLSHEGVDEVRAYTDWRMMLGSIKDSGAYIFVIDHNLGSVSGLDIIDRIKSRCRFYKIIVVSGSMDLEVVVKYANSGIRNYIVKGTEIFNLVNYVKDAKSELLDQLSNIKKLRDGVEGLG